MARLGDIFTISSGGTPNKNELSYYKGGSIPWVKTGDLKDKYISKEIECITEEGLSNSSAKLFPQDTVLVAMYGATIGACSILPYEAATNQACAAFLPCKDVIPEYLFYFLSGRKDQFIKDGVGGAQPNISAGYLKNVKFDLVSLGEQQKVIDRLSKVDDLISFRKQQLSKLDELVKSRFIELFGDPEQNPNGYPIKDFDEISVLITDGEHATPRRTEKGIYLLSARNVLNHALQLDDVDYIDEDEYARIARRVVPQAGDILVSCSGSIGRCCVVPDGLQFQMVRSAALIRFDDTINPVFAEWLITSDELQRQIAQSATQSSQANLFQGKIRKLHGYVPPMELQQQFAAFVEQTHKSKLVIQKSLEKLETLKKALMQNYFG